MFTGIITEIGIVKSIRKTGAGIKLGISCKKTSQGINIGDSVAVNGVCLSVVKKICGVILFDVVRNTVNTTGLKRLRIGSKVNLENAMRMGDSFSGHIVSGHIDGERPVKISNQPDGNSIIEINITNEDKKYLVPKGSVTIDGISLTIGEISNDSVKIFIIPHTLENSILKNKKSGDFVNIEFDVLAKHAANPFARKESINKRPSPRKISIDKLRENGFL